MAVVFGVREKEKGFRNLFNNFFFFSVISSVSIYCDRLRLEMAYSVINGKKRVQFGLDLFNFWSQVGIRISVIATNHDSFRFCFRY